MVEGSGCGASQRRSRAHMYNNICIRMYEVVEIPRNTSNTALSCTARLAAKSRPPLQYRRTSHGVRCRAQRVAQTTGRTRGPDELSPHGGRRPKNCAVSSCSKMTVPREAERIGPGDGGSSLIRGGELAAQADGRRPMDGGPASPRCLGVTSGISTCSLSPQVNLSLQLGALGDTAGRFLSMTGDCMISFDKQHLHVRFAQAPVI